MNVGRRKSGDKPSVHRCATDDDAKPSESEIIAVAAATEAYIHQQNEQDRRQTNPNAIILNCRYQPDSTQLDLPCGRISIKVSDEKSDQIPTEIQAQGEKIIIPAINKQKSFHLVATLRGCKQSQTIQNVKAGEVRKLFF